MKFMHVGDTHIGQVYKNDTRNNDIKEAFTQMVDYAISEKIDFIVHSGDLFDSGNPPLDSLLFVTDELNRLKTAGRINYNCLSFKRVCYLYHVVKF